MLIQFITKMFIPNIIWQRNTRLEMLPDQQGTTGYRGQGFWPAWDIHFDMTQSSLPHFSMLEPWGFPTHSLVSRSSSTMSYDGS